MCIVFSGRVTLSRKLRVKYEEINCYAKIYYLWEIIVNILINMLVII